MFLNFNLKKAMSKENILYFLKLFQFVTICCNKNLSI